MSTAQERMDRVVTTAKRLSKMHTQHAETPLYKDKPLDECYLCWPAQVQYDHAVRQYTHPQYEEAGQ